MGKFDRNIEDFVKFMTTKEKCIEHYNCYEVEDDNKRDTYLKFNHIIDDFIDFITDEYDIYNKELNKAEKLFIITYLVTHNDCLIEYRDIKYCLKTDDWDSLKNRYAILKIIDLFESKYGDIVNIIIDEYIEELIQPLKEKMSFNIAINKIKRSKVYNFGLGLKLNMISAGII